MIETLKLGNKSFDNNVKINYSNKKTIKKSNVNVNIVDDKVSVKIRKNINSKGYYKIIVKCGTTKKVRKITIAKSKKNKIFKLNINNKKTNVKKVYIKIRYNKKSKWSKTKRII